MSSPTSEGGVLSSLPPPASARTGSPVRRRSTTVGESDLTRPRLSPTLIRSNDLNDPQVLERQRTMDVDMAIQMAKARRETDLGSPIPKEEPPLSALAPLSPAEQQALDNARGDQLTFVDPEDIAIEESVLPRRASVIDLRSHLRETQDPSLLVSLSERSVSPEDLGSTGLGPQTGYQSGFYKSAFDFAPLEAYAKEEKVRLGPSPTTWSFPFQTPRRRHPPVTSDIAEEKVKSEVDGIDGSLSNGHPPHIGTLPRASRKTAGGKLALFEGDTAAPPPSLHEPFTPMPTTSARLGTVPSMEHLTSTVPVLSTLHPQQTMAYRFSFYSNALSATIHSRSLSELPSEGQSFEELFTGIPSGHISRVDSATTHRSRPFMTDPLSRSASPAPEGTRTPKPPGVSLFSPTGKPDLNKNRFNPASADADSNTWWLDILNPTDEEMKTLSKVFSIHPLTTEDILMEEAREKIELFRSYYFVCFRSFEQDPYSPTHLEPLNMYIIVFREGILSFHFRSAAHPQNVRRRIKQLKDYISVTSDWISYALIDDITDAFGPLIQSIEYEVDSIDELVLILKEAEQSDMLRRIGRCRKKVMGLLRLMGNKADVVKGLAKRCNEHWQVAPTSDIGLYLSDIQDHLITMTQNLNHYEKILSRSHSNYLAQISIEMTEANNQINDVLSKLTALGTVLIPMNLVTGLWGMNVHVPGQDVPGYAWFLSIIAVLAAFAIIGGYLTYKFMVKRT